MKRIILSAVVGLALGAGSATAEITPIGGPFLDPSKSTLFLQEYKQGAQVTYLSDFCNPLVPHLAEVFGDSRGEAWLTCLRTINAINEETPGWRNPDSIDSGQRMLLIWPGNFEEPYLSDLRERVAEIGKVNNLANDPRAMAAMLIAMSNRGAAELNDEQMRQLANDLEAAAVAAVKEIPESTQFLKMVEDAVNKNLAARSETPVTVDLSGIESAIQANKNAIQANKNAIAALPTAEKIAADAAKLVQLSDADKADIAAQVPVPATPTAEQVAAEISTVDVAQNVQLSESDMATIAAQVPVPLAPEVDIDALAQGAAEKVINSDAFKKQQGLVAKLVSPNGTLKTDKAAVIGILAEANITDAKGVPLATTSEATLAMLVGLGVLAEDQKTLLLSSKEDIKQLDGRMNSLWFGIIAVALAVTGLALWNWFQGRAISAVRKGLRVIAQNGQVIEGMPEIVALQDMRVGKSIQVLVRTASNKEVFTVQFAKTAQGFVTADIPGHREKNPIRSDRLVDVLLAAVDRNAFAQPVSDSNPTPATRKQTVTPPITGGAQPA